MEKNLDRVSKDGGKKGGGGTQEQVDAVSCAEVRSVRAVHCAVRHVQVDAFRCAEMRVMRHVQSAVRHQQVKEACCSVIHDGKEARCAECSETRTGRFCWAYKVQ